MAIQNSPTHADIPQGNTTTLMIVPEPTGLPVKFGEAYSRAMLEIEHLLDSPDVLRRFAHVLLTEIRTKPALQACSPDSFIAAVIEMAEENLDPTGMNECFLVPYQGRVTMQRGYAGLIKLACSHPEVMDIFADEVCINDTYEFYGISTRPKHVYPGAFQPRGRYIGYYAVAQLTQNRWRAVQMSVEEIKAHAKQYSQNAGNKVWSEDRGGGFRGMALKTVLRKLCNPKYIPMAARVYEKLHQQSVAEGLIVDTMIVAEPLALREPEKTTEGHISDICGDQGAVDATLAAYRQGIPPDSRQDRATQEGQIERLLTEQGLTPEQRDTYWQGLRAKHADLSPGLLTSLYENMQAGAPRTDDAPGASSALATIQARLGWTAQEKKTWENKQARRFKKTYSELPAETIRVLIVELEGQQQTAAEPTFQKAQQGQEGAGEKKAVSAEAGSGLHNQQAGSDFPDDFPPGHPDTPLAVDLETVEINDTEPTLWEEEERGPYGREH